MEIAIDARSLRKKGGGISLRIYKIVHYVLNETQASLVLFCTEGLSFDDVKLDEAFKPRVQFINLNPDGMGPSEVSYNVDMNVIPKLLAERKPNVYHACANWGISSKEISTPSLLTIHDVIPFYVREGVFSDDNLFELYKKLLSASADNATRIITVSHYSKRAMVEKLGVEEDKVTVIPNGLDRKARPEHYKGKGGRLLSENGLTEEKYFIYIGGFYERKNVIRMAKAFRLFLKDHPEYKLIVTGDNKGSDYVRNRYALFEEEIADIKDNVYFMGYISREDLNMLIANAMALIYPSINEGFGIPILEAMNLDVPALCSNNTVMPEIGREAALYFDPFDVEAISCSIKAIVNNPELRTEKISLGRERASQFGWQDTCRKVFQVYEELAMAGQKG